MASSFSTNSCIHCHNTPTEPLINGWRSVTGEYVRLCSSCYSIFKAGLFCVTFHLNEPGWRGCNYCEKVFHCGCIVSLDDYSLGDFGGINCVDCSTANFPLAHHHFNAERNPQDLVTQSNFTFPPSDLIYLFEKSISSSDAKIRNSRMVIPVQDARAFFPEISAGQTIPISILDTNGEEWGFNYRCWLQQNRKTFTLQGLKKFIISKNLQAGDTVTFYKRQSNETIIVDVKKTSGETSPHQA